MAADELVVVGRIGRPHGLMGEVRAMPTGTTLATLGAGDTVVLAGAGAGAGQTTTIAALRPVDRGALIMFEGVASRDAAQALTGATIAVEATRLVALDAPDEFYVRDLIGCVVSSGDVPLGPVVEVYPGAANDALVVATADGGKVLVPFTKDAVLELDLPGRRVVIRPDLLGVES